LSERESYTETSSIFSGSCGNWLKPKIESP
jgi:hypothetical protein